MYTRCYGWPGNMLQGTRALVRSWSFLSFNIYTQNNDNNNNVHKCVVCVCVCVCVCVQLYLEYKGHFNIAVPIRI